ncbi:MAG: hypothetical protein AB8G77_01675 [Rhodothermales bacterium]
MYSNKTTSQKESNFSDIRHVFARGSVLLFMIFLMAGCASVNYVGEEHTPTESVDIYYSEAAIEKEYELIGHGLGSGFWVRNHKIEGKLISEAKEKGADAILITGLGKSNVMLTNALSADEKHMNAVFLRYR